MNFEDLTDPYCNTLLDVLEEHGGSAIVSSDTLARHIRDTHPRIALIASIIRTSRAWSAGFPPTSDEEEFYRRTLELYDEVVFRCPPDVDRRLLDALADVAGRCQAIVNHVCPSTCPLYAEHSVIVEQDILAGKQDVTRCWRGDSSDATRCLSNKLMEELVERGFVNMKIAGRSYAPYDFARNVLRFVEGDADYASTLIPELMRAVKLASLPQFDERKYCRLPE